MTTSSDSPLATLPSRVYIREEGPRDGWQNIETPIIPTEEKLAHITALADAGLSRITVTSMVSPKWVPQLADGPAVLRRLEPRAGVRYGDLVPNEKGLDRLFPLLDAGAPVSEIQVVVSVSEAHNLANVNMTVSDSLQVLERTVARAHAAGLSVCGGMATVFGCSLAGRVPMDDVVSVARALASMGVDELTLGDTTGMANPRQVVEVIAALRDVLPSMRLTPHFHNTRGAGLANVLTALQLGVDSFETAYGELGGCQFARGATGNVATEDLVCMLHEMGIDTGVDLPKLLEVVARVEHLLGRPVVSHVSSAGPVVWEPSSVSATP